MTALERVCVLYARHAGVSRETCEVRREAAARLAAWPLWARVTARAAAFALFWAGPSALLGRFRRLEGVSPAELEEILGRLQRVGAPPVRGAFLALKSIVLPSCYGPGAGS